MLIEKHQIPLADDYYKIFQALLLMRQVRMIEGGTALVLMKS